LFNKLWKKLTSKAYREAYVAAHLKRSVPFQVRALRDQRGWSQAQLAERSGLTQGAVSRAEDPDYGNLSFNTVIRLAAGFDVAFVGAFIPFSELGQRVATQNETSVQVLSFDHDSPSAVGNVKTQFVYGPGTEAGVVVYYDSFTMPPRTISVDANVGTVPAALLAQAQTELTGYSRIN